VPDRLLQSRGQEADVDDQLAVVDCAHRPAGQHRLTDPFDFDQELVRVHADDGAKRLPFLGLKELITDFDGYLLGHGYWLEA
jgi:hypothetical protein